MAAVSPTSTHTVDGGHSSHARKCSEADESKYGSPHTQSDAAVASTPGRVVRCALPTEPLKWAKHVVHTLWPVVAANHPCEHGSGTDVNVVQKWPSGHGWHSSFEVRLVAAPHVPAVHGIGEEAPSAQ